jgi:dienelactone hydrolase
MHPDGNGPFPLAVMNHGASWISKHNRGDRYHRTNAAFYFLSRGYAVALPMMRGFSTSDGEIYHNGCDLAATGIAYAKDIRAVIRFLDGDRLFDTSRVVVAGQSMGGWNTLALGALNVPSVKGLIDFNGGVRESDCDEGDRALVEGAARFGAATRTPSLWFYGDNDRYFAPPVWRAMYDAYTRQGAPAALLDVGTVMESSHNFLAYPEMLPVWTARVDAFLAAIGMPHAVVHPGDLPQAFPAASGYAAVNDVAAIPYVSSNGRTLYRSFLEMPYPRAFVISTSGMAVSMSEGFDPLGRALAACERGGGQCEPYAVDDHVVWKPRPQALARGG